MELKFWEKVHLPSEVTCHVSHVTCHMSHYIYISFFLNLDIVVQLVWWGSVINGVYPIILTPKLCKTVSLNSALHCKKVSFQSIGPLGKCFLYVELSVCLFVCPSVCSLLRYRLNVFLPPLPKFKCPIPLEIRNPWEKVMERSGLRFEQFFWKWSKIAKQKKIVFWLILP